MESIRAMERADVPAVNAIYNEYIAGTHISFDTEPWSDAKRLEWFDTHEGNPRHPRVVMVGDGVVGAAWAGPYRHKPAYARSVETTVVLSAAATGRGRGRRLLLALIDHLNATDVHRAYAVVALPNEASVRLHLSLGYRTVGVLDESGYKFDRYWSTQLLELALPTS